MRDRARRWFSRLPGPVAAVIDLLRPSVRGAFGGPFNGQQRRTEAVREIFRRVRFASVIETGTYRGTTTLMLRNLADAPIATIEANSRYYHYSRMRLLRQRRVTVFRGDSARVLRRLSTRAPWNLNPAFFYLDAHWREALPLPDELEVMAAGWRDFVAVVDDFRVPADGGYGYDDYGPGRALEPAILARLIGHGVNVYWPAAPSGSETGARRGWVALASSGAMDEALGGVEGLRPGGPVEAVVGSFPPPPVTK